jgi:hypothetical protein
MGMKDGVYKRWKQDWPQPVCFELLILQAAKYHVASHGIYQPLPMAVQNGRMHSVKRISKELGYG